MHQKIKLSYIFSCSQNMKTIDIQPSFISLMVYNKKYFWSVQYKYMSSSEKQFVDYCPSIKATDDKYPTVQKKLKETGCLSENEKLNACLHNNWKDWSKCKQQNMALYLCVKGAKQNSQIK